MAKLQTRTWLSRALSSSFSSALARRANCMRQPSPCNFAKCSPILIFLTHTLSFVSNKPFLIWLLATPPHLKYAATLPCNLSLGACFPDIKLNVSRGTVATYARCGGIFNIHLTANFLRDLPMSTATVVQGPAVYCRINPNFPVQP